MESSVPDWMVFEQTRALTGTSGMLEERVLATTKRFLGAAFDASAPAFGSFAAKPVSV